MPLPVLHLSPDWGMTESVSVPVHRMELGDGYTQLSEAGVHTRLRRWSVTRSGLTMAQLNSLLADLRNFSGAQPFVWRPHASFPFVAVTCANWVYKSMGSGSVWELSGEFVEDPRGIV